MVGERDKKTASAASSRMSQRATGSGCHVASASSWSPVILGRCLRVAALAQVSSRFPRTGNWSFKICDSEGTLCRNRIQPDDTQASSSCKLILCFPGGASLGSFCSLPYFAPTPLWVPVLLVWFGIIGRGWIPDRVQLGDLLGDSQALDG